MSLDHYPPLSSGCKVLSTANDLEKSCSLWGRFPWYRPLLSHAIEVYYLPGSHFTRAIASSTQSDYRVQISSRRPQRIYDSILRKSPELLESGRVLPPVPADITHPDTLKEAFKDASVVISLVGLMHGSREDFDRIQHRGAQNVARAAQKVGAKLIHFSAIGADPRSDIPYFETKGLGEKAVLKENPKSTIIRPSLVFGSGDGFFSVCNHTPQIAVDGIITYPNRNSQQCHLLCHSCRSLPEVQPTSSRSMSEI